jgi:large subunit ribosomal protein L25
MTDTLHVKNRADIGSASTRRLRRSGLVPAVLYGHGEPNVNLVLPADEVLELVRHHGKTVKLTGAVDEHALVKKVQFDALGSDVLHLDFYRVRLDEKVVTKLPIRLHGQAAGVLAGGMLRETVREVEIRCPVVSLPDDLQLNINDIGIGGHKTAGDVILPEGAELLTAKELVVVQVVEAPKDVDLTTTSGPAEPELITKPKAADATEEKKK